MFLRMLASGAAGSVASIAFNGRRNQEPTIVVVALTYPLTLKNVSLIS
jgi:hypothetical protein